MNAYLSPHAVRCLGLLALACSLSVGHAASDIFLRLGDLTGESADAAHPKWIAVDSMLWGLSKAGPTNSAQLQGLRIQKRADAASPALHLACAQGTHFPKATLDMVRTFERRVRYYRIELQDVFVTSCVAGGTGEDSGVSEGLELAFARVSWTYTEFGSDGRPVRDLASYWDQLTGTGEATVKDALRVSGAPQATGTGFGLSFPSSQGVTYRIMGSPDPMGPYLEVSRFTAESSGPTNQSLPIVGGRQFFYLEEVP